MPIKLKEELTESWFLFFIEYRIEQKLNGHQSETYQLNSSSEYSLKSPTQIPNIFERMKYLHVHRESALLL